MSSRPSKKRRLIETIDELNNMNIDERFTPSDEYRPYEILGNIYHIAPNRRCCLRFESSNKSMTTRHLQTWVEVQTAVESLLKFIGTLPRDESVVVTTLFDNPYDSIMSKSSEDCDPIIWTLDGLTTSIIL